MGSYRRVKIIKDVNMELRVGDVVWVEESLAKKLIEGGAAVSKHPTFRDVETRDDSDNA